MNRYIFAEQLTAVALGKFLTGSTVTIAVYNKSTGTAEALTSNVCSEIGATGFFKWPWSNLTTPPASFTEYLFVMSDGAGAERAEEVIFGGYPDTLVASVISSPSGASAVAINVQEADTTPINTVKVAIYDATNTVLLGSGTTDASGQFAFTIDNGNYKIRLSKLQTNFSATEDLVVSGITSATYIGEVLTIPVPSDPQVCRIDSYSFNQSGQNPTQTFDGTAQITSLPYNANGMYHVGQKVLGTYSTATGNFYWILPRGAVVRFRADSLGIDAQATVPDIANALLESLI